jgi:hypothetical protein
MYCYLCILKYSNIEIELHILDTYAGKQLYDVANVKMMLKMNNQI